MTQPSQKQFLALWLRRISFLVPGFFLQPLARLAWAAAGDLDPTFAGGSNDFAVVRLNANGSLDSSFHADGQVVISSFGGDDRAPGVAISPVDGKIVAAGYTDGLGSNDVAVARYLTK